MNYGQCFVNNCLTQSLTDNVCATCPSLFTYEAGVCVNKAQANCLYYDQIMNFNTNIRSVNCMSCLDGYYLRTDFTCSQMIVNCESTDSQTGRCTRCINGFTIYEERCILQITGCTIYNNLNNYQTCKQCQQGYNLISDNTRCVNLPLRCLELNSTGYCAKCSTGYNPIVQNG